jgi:hypothetical protein
VNFCREFAEKVVMAKKTHKSLLLVEFAVHDKFTRAVSFPFISGFAKKAGIQVHWIRFGISSDETEIFQEKDLLCYRNILSQTKPAFILFSHVPEQIFLQACHDMSLDAECGVIADSLEEKISPLIEKKLKKIPVNLQFLYSWLCIEEKAFSEEFCAEAIYEIIVPDFSWTAGNKEAEESFPDVCIICGNACSYGRKIENNPIFRGISLKDCRRPYGCAFCSKQPGIKPWRKKPLLLAKRQLQAFLKTHSGYRGRPRITIRGDQLFNSIDNFSMYVKDNLPPSDLLFEIRADLLLKNEKKLKKACRILKGTGHVLHLCIVGIENFSHEELQRLNKGMTPEKNLKSLELIVKAIESFPDTFRFDEYGGASMILFNPWTTLKDLAINLKILQEPWWPQGKAPKKEYRFGKSLNTRVRLYEGLALTCLAKHQGLLIQAYEDSVFNTSLHMGNPPELPWRFRKKELEPVNSILARLEPDNFLKNDPLYVEIQSWLSSIPEHRKVLYQAAEAVVGAAMNKAHSISELLKEAKKRLVSETFPKKIRKGDFKKAGPEFFRILRRLRNLNKRKNLQKYKIPASRKKSLIQKDKKNIIFRKLQKLMEFAQMTEKRFSGFNLSFLSDSPEGHVFVTLIQADQKIILKIEKYSSAGNYFLEAEGYSISYSRETPLDTPQKEKAVREFAELLKSCA